MRTRSSTSRQTRLSTSRQTRDCHSRNSPTSSVSKRKVLQVPSKKRNTPTTRNPGGQRRMKSGQALAGAGPSSKRPVVMRQVLSDAYTMISELQSSIGASTEKTGHDPHSSVDSESYVNNLNGNNHSHAYRPMSNAKTNKKSTRTSIKTSNKSRDVFNVTMNLYMDRQPVNDGKQSGTNKEAYED